MGFLKGYSTFDFFKLVSKYSDGMIRMEGDLLKKYQKVVLSIAEDVIDVGEEEGVTYHLTGGSALGAVRHHGFIPWDDDIDIDMLGSDFDRFVKAFQAKYPDKYTVQTCRTPGYGIMINKVRLRDSVMRGKEDLNSDDCGIFVDIIRIENTFNNPVLRKIHGFFCMGMGFLLSCRNFYMNRRLMNSLADSLEKNPRFNDEEKLREIRKVFKNKIRIGRLISFLTVRRWAILTQWCYGLCKNGASEYVSVPGGRNHYFGEMYKRSDFAETVRMAYEGHMWCVPKDYDAYLRHMYGDYMAVPEDAQREEHVILELRFPGEERSVYAEGYGPDAKDAE